MALSQTVQSEQSAEWDREVNTCRRWWGYTAEEWTKTAVTSVIPLCSFHQLLCHTFPGAVRTRRGDARSQNYWGSTTGSITVAGSELLIEWCKPKVVPSPLYQCMALLEVILIGISLRGLDVFVKGLFGSVLEDYFASTKFGSRLLLMMALRDNEFLDVTLLGCFGEELALRTQ